MRPPVGEQMSRQPSLPSPTRGKPGADLASDASEQPNNHHPLNLERASSRPHLPRNLLPHQRLQHRFPARPLDTAPLLHRCRSVSLRHSDTPSLAAGLNARRGIPMLDRLLELEEQGWEALFHRPNPSSSATSG